MKAAAGLPLVALGLVVSASVMAGAVIGRSDVKRFDEDGYGITFTYPDDLHVTDKVFLIDPAAKKPDELRGLLRADTSGVFVFKSQLEKRVTSASLNFAQLGFDSGIEHLDPDAVPGEQVEYGGLPGLEYHVSLLNPPSHSRQIYLFDQTTGYLISCQSTPPYQDAVASDCDEILDSIERR